MTLVGVKEKQRDNCYSFILENIQQQTFYGWIMGLSFVKTIRNQSKHIHKKTQVAGAAKPITKRITKAGIRNFTVPVEGCCKI